VFYCGGKPHSCFLSALLSVTRNCTCGERDQYSRVCRLSICESTWLNKWRSCHWVFSWRTWQKSETVTWRCLHMHYHVELFQISTSCNNSWCAHDGPMRRLVGRGNFFIENKILKVVWTNFESSLQTTHYFQIHFWKLKTLVSPRDSEEWRNGDYERSHSSSNESTPFRCDFFPELCRLQSASSYTRLWSWLRTTICVKSGRSSVRGRDDVLKVCFRGRNRY